MIILLISILGLATWGYTWRRNNHYDNLFIASGFVGWIALIISIIVFLATFGTSAKLEADYKVVLGIYAGSVESYQIKALLPVQKNETALTDFKNQSYQETMGNLILSHRNRLANYNSGLIQLRKWNNNIFFSWIIAVPSDDCKIIEWPS